MDKLQYDSFYKFIVSLGVVLIATPILGIYYILNGSYDKILSKEEYENLSSFSIELLNNKEKMLGLTSSVLPWILIGIIVLGVYCIIWGGRKWYRIQKTLDEEIQLNVDEKRFKYKKLTAEEIAQKAIQETIETQDISDISNLSTQSQRIVKGLQIEQQCFNYLNKKLSKSHSVKNNVRIGKNEIDVLAISKKNDVDIIYEIKYWTNPVTKATIFHILKRMEALSNDYKNITHHNCKCIIMIVSNSDNFNIMKDYINTNFSNTNKNYPYIDIKVMAEEELL